MTSRPDATTSRPPSAFRKENIPAYAAVMGSTVLAGLAAGALGYLLVAAPLRSHIVTSVLFSGLLGAFGGMSVMFIASLLNLRKLRPGFARLARGEAPDIPPVWCPVLTSATVAAKELSSHVTRPPHPVQT